MADSTEVIVVDLRTEALRARREKIEALRTTRHGIIVKTVLGALLLLALSAVLFALLRR